MYERRNEPHQDVRAGPPRDPSVPTIGGGRYALVAKIAQGGMAGVYRAWDRKLKLWRAVKVLLPEYAERASLRSRFETEASTMASLDHPHVVRVFDVVTNEALPFMVMDLAEGGTLNGWLDAYGPMPPRLACDVLTQVAAGLAAAHLSGVVHRDVKPHNVLIGLDGRCKVTDFGIARVRMGSVSGMTRTGSTMGTIGYMAPEQRADAKWVDMRADIYSLGALLYKLLTGVIVTDLFLVEHEPGLLENIPPALHEVILKACYHDRERRYPDTHALVETLEDVRPLLPDDPSGTPPLPIPMEDDSLDRTHSVDAFGEIAELLAPPVRPAAPQPTPSQLLPYRMPRLDGSDPRSPQGRVRRPPPIKAPREPLPMAPTLASTKAPPAANNLPWPRVFALVVATSLMMLAVVLGGVLLHVRTQASRAANADLDLYDVITKNSGVVHDLRSAGAPEAELGRLYDLFLEVEEAAIGPQRHAAASTYINALTAQAGRLGERKGADLAKLRADSVDRAFSKSLRAHGRWERTASGMAGRTVLSLGLVESP